MRVGSFTKGTVQQGSPYSPVADTASTQQSTGPFPSRAPFGSHGRRSSWLRSEGFCSSLVPESYALLRLLAPRRLDLRSRLYPCLPPGGSRSTFVFPVSHPFVCGCHIIATIPSRLDDTRSPWVTHASSPPCRPHTPWYDEEEPSCLLLHSAGSTIPRLWPTGSSVGWLPLITTWWFSASPSDSTSRWTPCPPKPSGLGQ
jgi:hypothetical protein